MDGRRLGFPPSFAPRRPGADDARRGRDRPSSTNLELLVQRHIGFILQSCSSLTACDFASQRGKLASVDDRFGPLDRLPAHDQVSDCSARAAQGGLDKWIHAIAIVDLQPAGAGVGDCLGELVLKCGLELGLCCAGRGFDRQPHPAVLDDQPSELVAPRWLLWYAPANVRSLDAGDTGEARRDRACSAGAADDPQCLAFR